MTINSDTLAVIRQDFARRWQPGGDDNYRRRDFEIGLDRLIYAIFKVAQEPFIKELEIFKEDALKSAFSSSSAKPIIS